MKKLISSIISLLMTLMLMITCLFAWYTSNSEVSAGGIIASTAGEKYEFTLFVYQTSEYKEVTNRITIDNIEPNDYIYFKLEAKELNSSAAGFTCYFDDFSTKIASNTLFVDNSNVVLTTAVGNIFMYSLNENKVVVNDKTLYSYDVPTNVLTLKDYKLEDILKNNMYYTDSSRAVQAGANSSISSANPNAYVSGYTTTIYFALQYNVTDYDPNLYAYQTVSIDKFKIDMK